jgi:activator of HSP90 ATPase
MWHWQKAVLIAVMALFSAAAMSAPQDPLTIHQEADILASPEQVYAALLDEKQFTRITGAPARIDGGPGGSFSLFGGTIVGRNIELVPANTLVQAWRVKNWPPGVYSRVRFKLTAKGEGTHIVLDQTGFPADDFHGLSIGWPEHYWTPLKRLSPKK